MNERTYENATHFLRCRHAIGTNGLDYLMRCHVLNGGRVSKSGKIKILVFGNRYWSGYDHISRIRYVFKHRVKKIVPPQTNQNKT